MKCIIVDDEFSARSRLRRLLEPYNQVELVGFAEDGIKALEQIEKLRPQLIFLDVQMPGLNGFEVLQACPSEIMPLVVFVTGFDEYALNAFEANALAYLLKPIENNNLAVAVERREKLIRYGAWQDEQQQINRFVAAAKPLHLRQVVGRKHGKLFLLAPEEILFFQLENSIVKAHTANDCFWVNYQLNELEAGLPEFMFFRAHRSTLVNLRQVREVKPFFKSSFLLVMGNVNRTEIQVSSRQAKLLREILPGL